MYRPNRRLRRRSQLNRSRSSNHSTHVAAPEVLEDRRLLALSSGLIGYWQFDGDVADESTLSNDLNQQEGVFDSGLFGQSLQFPGSATQRADRPVDDPEYDFGGDDFTVQTWVNYDSLGGEQTLIEKFVGSSGPGWTISSVPTNDRLIFHSDATGQFNAFTPQINVAGVWNQIVLRRLGTQFEFFVNGQSIGSVSSGGTITDHGTPLQIGERNGSQSFPLTGKVDETAIWNRALTNQEISDLFNGGSGMQIADNSLNWQGDIDSNWSTPGNWVENRAPVNGDTLVFDSATPGLGSFASTNDLPSGTTFDTILFNESTGNTNTFSIDGAAIGISNRIESQGTDGAAGSIEVPVILQNDVSVVSANVLTFNGVVDLNGHRLTQQPGTTATQYLQPITGTGEIQIDAPALFWADNDYSAITTISSDLTVLFNGTLGDTNSNTVLDSGVLRVTRTGAINEDIVIQGNQSAVLAVGGVQLAGDLHLDSPTGTTRLNWNSGTSTGVFEVSGQITGTSLADLSFGAAFNSSQITRISNPLNNYSANTLIPTGSGFVQLGNNDVLPNGTNLNIEGNLDLNGHTEVIAGLSGNGLITTNASANGTAKIDVGLGDASSTFSGSIEDGDADSLVELNKTGMGTLTLTGTSTATGGITLSQGQLLIDGSVQSNVDVFTGGTLGGSGVLGSQLNFRPGATALAPGGAPGSTADLAVNGPVSLFDSTIVRVDLNGTSPDTQYDQLVVTGAGVDVNLADAELDISLGYTSASGDTFTIIDVQDPTSTVTGTFQGLADESEFTIGAENFRIDYDGGADGNDVVVTALGQITTSVEISGGDLVVTDTGSATDDTFTISRNVSFYFVRDNNHILQAGTGATQINPNLVRVPVASVANEIIIDSGDGDDSLTIDFRDAGTGGLFDHPVIYNGGDEVSSTGDSLSLIRGTFDSTIYNFQNVSGDDFNGTIDLTGNSLITYTGLEPITSSINATDVTLNYDTAGQTINVSDVGGSQTNVDAPMSAESITFNNPTGTLTINAGDIGNDVINLTSLAANYPASVTVNGQGGDDTIIGIGPISLDNENLSLTAEAINLGSAAINTGAGDQAYNGPVTLLADTTLTGNDITFNGPVDSNASPQSLNVVADGVTSFNGHVGATNPLASLTTDAAGSTDFGTNSSVPTPGAFWENNAAFDPNTADDRWPEIAGAVNNVGQGFELLLDTSLAVAFNPAPTTGLPGLTAAYTFPGAPTGTTDSQRNQAGGQWVIQGTTTPTSPQTIAPNPDTLDVSVEIWFKPDDLVTPDAGEVLFETGGGTGIGFYLSDNMLSWRKAGGGGNATVDVTGLESEFIHAIGTYDNSSGDLQLFVNNGVPATDSGSGGDWDGGDPAGVATIGGVNAGGIGGGSQGMRPFDGDIAVFRMYSSILSAGQVADNYNAVALSIPNISVTTTGDQTFGDTVEVGVDATFDGTNVEFTDALDTNGNAAGVTVNASGDTTFGANVGATNRLKTLTSDAGGTTNLIGDMVNTLEQQSYADAVLLTGNVTLSGADVTFEASVDAALGGGGLSVNTSGESVTTFGSLVGGANPLSSIHTNADGTTIFTANVTTNGDQQYFDSVRVTADADFTGDNVTFAAAFDDDGAGAAANVNVVASGTTLFLQDIGAASPLASLSTDAAGTTVFGRSLNSGSLTTGLEAYLPFDAESGGVTADASGNGRDGTLNGDAAIQPAVFNNGVTLDGVADFVELNTYAGVTSTTARTMSAWVNIPAGGVNDVDGGIMSWGSGASSTKWVFRSASGRLRVETANGGVESTPATINDGQWHHVAAVYDGSGNHNGISFYIDGVLQGITANSGAAINTGSGANVQIGTDRVTANNNTRDLQSQIDEAAIWSRALTADEIALLAASPSISVSTSGDQSFGDAIELNADLTIFADDATFGGSIDSAAPSLNRTLAIHSGFDGVTTFTADVGSVNPLGGLTTDEIGTTELAGDVAFTINGNIQFGDPVNGNGIGFHDLTINTPGGGDSVFHGPVGNVSPLGSLTTDSVGQTVFGPLPVLAPTAGATLNFDADVETDNVWQPTVDPAAGAQNWTFGGDVSLQDVSGTTAIPGIVNAYRFTGGAGAENTGLNDLTDDPSDASASWEFWIRPDDTGDANQILFETGGSGTGMAIWYSVDTPGDGMGTLKFTIDDDSVQQTIQTTIDTSDFRQIVSVYAKDEFGAFDRMELFVDGVSVAVDTSNTLLDDWDGGDPAGLGNLGSGGLAQTAANGEYDGDMAIYRFYESALTSREVLENFAAVAYSALPISVNTSPNGQLHGDQVSLMSDVSFDSGADIDFVNGVTGNGNVSLSVAGEAVFPLATTSNYDGTTNVTAGLLLVNGVIDSDTDVVTIDNGATLGGNGTISRPVEVLGGGTVSPGNSAGAIAIGNFNLQSGSSLVAEIDGTAGAGAVGGHDQVAVNGTVTLAGSLDTTGSDIVGATLGDVFVIIDNDMADAVIGTFDGLPNGADVVVNGEDFRVFYDGGDGNDVVLIRKDDDLAIALVDDDWTGTIPGTDPDGAGPAQFFLIDSFPTIQGAIDQLSVSPGTVQIYPGVYAENVTFAQNLTLTGISGNAADVLISPAAGVAIADAAPTVNVTIENLSVLSANDDGVNISDVSGTLTFNNVVASGNFGDGFDLSNVGNVVMTNVVASNNDPGLLINGAASFSDTDGVYSGNDDHGIQLIDISGNVTLVRTTLEDNDADNDLTGDGLNASDGGDLDSIAIGGDLLIQGATIADTDAAGAAAHQRNGVFVGLFGGGGVGGNVTIEDSTGTVQSTMVTGHEARGIHLESTTGSVQLSNVAASGNFQENVFVSSADSAAVNGGSFNNSASSTGLALFSINGAAQLTNVTANGNDLRNLDIGSAASVTISGGSFSNAGSDSGVRLENIVGNAQLTNVTANTNSANNLFGFMVGSVTINGGSYSNSPTASGVRLENTTGAVQLTGVTASGNLQANLSTVFAGSVAINGGQFNNSPFSSGINIDSTTTSVTLSDATVTGNVLASVVGSVPTVTLNTTTGGVQDTVRLNDPFLGDGTLEHNRGGTLQDVLTFGAVGQFNVNFQGDDDTVHVTADPTTVINLDGGPHASGDTLFYVSDTASSFTWGSSTIATVGHANVNYTNFENFRLTGDLVITGSNQDDHLTVTGTGRDDGSFQLITDVTGAPDTGPVVSFQDLNYLQFLGQGGDDLFDLVMDFPALDDIFLLPSAIQFQGGLQTDLNQLGLPGDMLRILGPAAPLDSIRSFMPLPDPTGNGIDLQLQATTLGIPTPQTLVSAIGLEPVIDNLNAADRVFTFVAGSETITLSDDGDAGDGESFIDSTLGEAVTFSNPTNSLTIEVDAGGGMGPDTINVEGVDSTFNADLTIAASADDTVNIQGVTLDIDTGNLSVTAGPIDVTEAINAANATFTNGGLLDIGASGDMSLTGSFLQNGTGNVETSADITTSGGSIQFDSAIELTANLVTLNSNGGNVTLNDTVDDDGGVPNRSLTIAAGAGAVDINGAIGDIAPLDVLDITGATNIGGDITTAGSQTYDGNVGFSGSRTLTAADVTFRNGTTTLPNATTTFAATTVTSEVTNAIALTRGMLTLSGATNLISNGSVTLSDGGGNFNIGGSGTFTNNATFNHVASGGSDNLELIGSVVLQNNGTFDFQQRGDIRLEGTTRFNNAGLLLKSVAGSDQSFVFGSGSDRGTFHNLAGGEVRSNAGTLNIGTDGNATDFSTSDPAATWTADGGNIHLSGFNAWTGTFNGSALGSSFVTIENNGNGTVPDDFEVGTGGVVFNISDNGVRWSASNIDTNGNTYTNVAVMAIVGGAAKELQGNGELVTGNGGVTTLDATVTSTGGSSMRVASGGLLDGSGTFSGAVTVDNGGTIAPGLDLEVLGTGDLTLAAGSAFDIEIDGTAGAGVVGGHDQLDVTGSVSLAGDLVIDLAFTPVPGDAFMIIDNDTNGDPVTGTFNGLPEGATFFANTGDITTPLEITYIGGDGNDVVVAFDSTIVIDGTNLDDDFFVRVLGSNLQVFAGVDDTGTLLLDTPQSQVTSLVINGLDGNDRLFAEYGTVLFEDPITFNGGGQTSGDSVTLLQSTVGPFDTVTHNFVNNNDGSIEVDGHATITYTGLEPITDNLDANNRVFNFTAAAAETITLEPGMVLDNRIDSDQGESVEFNNPNVSLTINTEVGGGAGADTVNVEGVDATFSANLTINGGADDTVTFQTAATAVGSANVLVNAMTINVDAALATAAGGTLDLNASRNITMSATGSLASVNGAISLDANPTGVAGNFAGISVIGGGISSDNGAITLTAQGGDAGTDNDGVFIQGGALIESIGLATISINGTSGTGDDSDGVDIGTGSVVSSVSGNIVITGATIDGDEGVDLETGAVIESTGVGPGAATITITGVAGAAANSGIDIELASQIISFDGNILIDGMAGMGDGVAITDSEVFSDGTATITITGDGGSDAISDGVFIASSFISSLAEGHILITGTGSATGDDGVDIGFGSVVESIGVAPTSATITIQGTSGTSDGVDLNTGAIVGSESGAILITGDALAGGDDGVDLDTAAFVDSIGVGPDAATITIIGTAVAGAEEGVDVNNSALFSVDGNIDITGVAVDGAGVELLSPGGGPPTLIDATGAATITISGTSTGVGPTTEGILIADGGTSVSAFAGNIVLAGSSADDAGIDVGFGVQIATGISNVILTTTSGSILQDGTIISGGAIDLDSIDSITFSGLGLASGAFNSLAENDSTVTGFGFISADGQTTIATANGAIDLQAGSSVDSAADNVVLDAATSITLAGDVRALSGEVDIDSGTTATLTDTGTVDAGSLVSIDSAAAQLIEGGIGPFVNDVTLDSGDTLTITATGSVTAGGTIIGISIGDTLIDGGTVSTIGNLIDFNAGGNFTLSNFGLLDGTLDVNITAGGDLTLADDTIVAGNGTVTLSGGQTGGAAISIVGDVAGDAIVINGGAGADSIVVDDNGGVLGDGGTVENLQTGNTVTINAGGGNDTLQLDDSGSADADVIDIDDSVNGLHETVLIDYNNVEFLEVNAGVFEDIYNVELSPNTAFLVHGNLPPSGSEPGDTLNMFTSDGLLNFPFVFFAGNDCVQPDCSFTDAPDQPINWTSIETFSIDGRVFEEGDLYVETDDTANRVIFYSTDGVGTRVRIDNVEFGPYPVLAGDRIIAFTNGGNDFVVVHGPVPPLAEFHGGTGNDYLAGNVTGDFIYGDLGNDIILGGEGDNFLHGDDPSQPGLGGNDRLEGRAGEDIIFGGAGNDRLNGGFGNDTLDGGFANDYIFGGQGDDFSFGGGSGTGGEDFGFDVIRDHLGNDVLFAGGGVDQLFGDRGNDLVVGGSGADRINGDAQDDYLANGTASTESIIDEALALLATGDDTLFNLNVLPALTTFRNSNGTDLSGFGTFTDDLSIDIITGGTGADVFDSGPGDINRNVRPGEGDIEI